MVNSCDDPNVMICLFAPVSGAVYTITFCLEAASYATTYLVKLSVWCMASCILKRKDDSVVYKQLYDVGGRTTAIFPKLSTGLGPRSTYIIRGIYGYRTVTNTVRAYCSRLEQKPICLLQQPVTAPENTVHTASRPLGQLESTSISWRVMIG